MSIVSLLLLGRRWRVLLPWGNSRELYRTYLRAGDLRAELHRARRERDEFAKGEGQAKTVNRELRLVIRNLIDGLSHTKLDNEGWALLSLAEPYATPQVMQDKRKVLGHKREPLHLNHPPKEPDDEARTT